MKIKRLLAGIVACAMAVSAMAFTASAEDNSYGDMNDDGQFEFSDYSIFTNPNIEIKVTYNNPESEAGWGNLGFGFSIDGGWKDITYSTDGGENEFVIAATKVMEDIEGDDVSTIEYGKIETMNSATLISVEVYEADPSAEEPKGEEDPIVAKAFIQMQEAGWNWVDGGDIPFEGEDSAVDVSLDLANLEDAENGFNISECEATPIFGIQVVDTRIKKAGQKSEFTYKVDAASIVVDGKTIDLDISDLDEIKKETNGKEEEWGFSGNDSQMLFNDLVKTLADEEEVEVLEYLSTIESIDATITLISYSEVTDPSAEEPAETPDAKNPTTGAGEEEDEDDDTKTPDAKNPSTGAGGIVAVVGMSALALTAVTVSRKRK